MVKKKTYDISEDRAETKVGHGKRRVYLCQSCGKETQENFKLEKCPKCGGICNPM